MKARNWKCILLLLALAGISLTAWGQAQFSWVFPPYPIVYFHAYRSVDIFVNPDEVGNLNCAVRFFDEDPDYIVKLPWSDVVKPNIWYTSTSYIGLTQVKGQPGLAVRFDYRITWTGSEKTKGWEKLPPDYGEVVEVKGGDQQSKVIFTTGTFTAEKGDHQRTLNFNANANDPHILVIRNLDWDPIHVKLPAAGTNPEKNFRVNGKSTFILVFYPNLHGNQLVFNWEWYKVSFEYIIKRIPAFNP